MGVGERWLPRMISKGNTGKWSPLSIDANERSTGARFVVTDNSGGRGGKAVELANYIKYSLRIESRPSSGEFSIYPGDG